MFALAAACSPKTAEAPAGPREGANVAASGEACIPPGYDRAKLDMLKAADFHIIDDAERQAFAIGIARCLSDPDPALRDGIAYEALARMMRANQLTPATMKALLADLQIRLEQPEDKPELGFQQPFAALVLSEIARADRIEPFLTDGELLALAVKAQFYMTNIRDYRGFDEKEGWRHGVAHGSDLLMQLALNPRIDKEALGLIVSGVGTQVAPNGHVYIHGESERLAQPVLFAAARGVKNEQQWTDWFKQLATPPIAIVEKLNASNDGLAWRHNTNAFLQALYVNARLSEDKADDVMLPGLESALKSMP